MVLAVTALTEQRDIRMCILEEQRAVVSMMHDQSLCHVAQHTAPVMLNHLRRQVFEVRRVVILALH